MSSAPRLQDHRRRATGALDAGHRGATVRSGEAAILRLQRQAGNRAVVAAVGRQPPVAQRKQQGPVNPLAAQWEADWQDPAFADARKRFNEKGRPKGTPRERYDVLCPLYAARGITRPLEYVTQHIVDTTFFGRDTPAHSDLAAKLGAAEQHYLATHSDTPIKRAWSFTARTTSKGSWSNHADGKAIDVDAPWNPHLQNARERRVIYGLTGMDIEKANPGADAGLDSFDAAQQASDRFQEAYTEAGLGIAIAFWTVTAPLHEAQRERLRAERDSIPAGRHATAADKARRKQLGGELIRLNRILGYRYKRERVPGLAETLQGELVRYRESQAAMQGAQLTVANLMAQIAVTVPRLSTGTKAERRGASREIKRLERSLRKARKAERRAQTTLGEYAEEGFLNLPKEFVTSMRAVGFRWGGDWRTHKDFMHFDL